jgi:hypothetical protein
MQRRTFDAEGVNWSVLDVVPEATLSLDPALASGWLCFENQLEIRRLAPIPAGWAAADDGEMRRLLKLATQSTRKSSRA